MLSSTYKIIMGLVCYDLITLFWVCMWLGEKEHLSYLMAAGRPGGGAAGHAGAGAS